MWPIDRTLLDATTLGQSEPGRINNEEVLPISQISSITWAPLSDFVSYSSALVVGILPLCRDTDGVFNSPSQLGHLNSSCFTE